MLMLIDMIPPEYWAQMRRELDSLGDVGISRAVAKATGKNAETEARRKKRIFAEYDRAIKKKLQEAAQVSRRRSKEKNK